MNKHKCKYCNNLIDKYDIRCFDCNLIWEDGAKAGEEFIKAELKNSVDKIKELLK